MKSTCREDLKNYALRKLGSPVLQINITPEQIEDRIDDALKIYWEWHHEGSYVDFITKQLTQQDLDSKSIAVDEWVYQVLGVMMLGNEYSQFNLEYQSYMSSLGSQFVMLGGRKYR